MPEDLVVGARQELPRRLVELVALGVRTGRTEFNGRRRDPGPSRIGLLFRLAPVGCRIPPGFINVYDIDWVKRPER